MKIRIETIPAEILDAIRELAAEQGERLTSPADFERYILEDEEAQELALYHIDL